MQPKTKKLKVKPVIILLAIVGIIIGIMIAMCRYSIALPYAQVGGDLDENIEQVYVPLDPIADKLVYYQAVCSTTYEKDCFYVTYDEEMNFYVRWYSHDRDCIQTLCSTGRESINNISTNGHWLILVAEEHAYVVNVYVPYLIPIISFQRGTNVGVSGTRIIYEDSETYQLHYLDMATNRKGLIPDLEAYEFVIKDGQLEYLDVRDEKVKTRPVEDL